MKTVETIRVKRDADEIVINKSDFDPAKHTLLSVTKPPLEITFTVEEKKPPIDPAPVKRGRGRPKG